MVWVEWTIDNWYDFVLDYIDIMVHRILRQNEKGMTLQRSKSVAKRIIQSLKAGWNPSEVTCQQKQQVPPGSLTVRPWKLPGPKRKGSSSKHHFSELLLFKLRECKVQVNRDLNKSYHLIPVVPCYWEGVPQDIYHFKIKIRN